MPHNTIDMRFFALTFFVALSLTVQAQRPTLLLAQQAQNSSAPSLFVNENGVPVFSLLPHDIPITMQKDQYGFWEEQHVLNPFSYSPCVVVERKNRSYYLIDSQGKLIKDFGTKYHRVRPFSEGYGLAWAIVPGTASLVGTYLDSLGNNVFGSRTFWEAGAFKNGLAAVQPEKNGPHGYIDKTGKMVVQLDTALTGEVSEMNPFYNDLAHVRMRVNGSKGNSNDMFNFDFIHYFIDRNGKVALDIQKLFPGKSVSFVNDFSEGVTLVGVVGQKDKKTGQSQTNIILLDTKGNQIRLFTNVNMAINSYHNPVKGMGYVMLGGPNSIGNILFFNIKGKDIAPVYDTKAIRMFYPMQITEDYYVIQGVYLKDVPKAGTIQPRNFIFSRKTNKIVYDTKDFIAGFYGDLIYTKGEDWQICKLIQLPNKVIWVTDPANRLYTSVAEALPVKNQVRYFNLVSSQQQNVPSEIFQFTNIENLTLGYSEFTAISEDIRNLKKLKKLELISLERLQSIPAAILELQQLEELSISDCGALAPGDVRNIIENLSALKKIKLVNFPIDNDFIEKMKTLKPALKIKSSTINYNIHEDMVMDLEFDQD